MTKLAPFQLHKAFSVHPFTRADPQRKAKIIGLDGLK